VDGKLQRVVKDLGFDLSHDLVVRIISPRKGDDLSQIKEVRILVAYPDESIVSEPVLSGFIGEQSVSFTGDGVGYSCPYTPDEGDSEVYVWVEDGRGNGGGADVAVSPHMSSLRGMSGGQMLFYAGLAVVLLVLLIAGWQYSMKKKQRDTMYREYEATVQKISGLKQVRKNLIQEYYQRRISEEDARKRVLDIEHELVFEKDRLKNVMQSLGMKYTETEGKEDILEWIAEKLSGGEDPELLKKGLTGMGLDGSLVDRVRTLKRV